MCTGTLVGILVFLTPQNHSSIPSTLLLVTLITYLTYVSMDNDFASFELFPGADAYRSASTERNQHQHQSQYPPLDPLFDFSAPRPQCEILEPSLQPHLQSISEESQSEAPAAPVASASASHAPRRRRQTTSSGTSQSYATSTTAEARHWHGPPQTTMDAGYASTKAFPIMREQSPPDLKPNVTSSAKSVKHKRGYQACEQCRQRKTGCQLGDDVDNPTDPPCNRCRREGKTCTFAATRKKRASSAGSSHPAERPRPHSAESSFQNTGGLHTQPANGVYQLPANAGTSGHYSAGNGDYPAFTQGIQSTFAPNLNPTSHPYNIPHHSQETAQPGCASRNAGMNGVTSGNQVRSDLAARALASDAPTTQENLGMLTAAAAAIAKHDEQSDSSFKSPSSFNSPSSAGRRGTFANGIPSDSMDGRLNEPPTNELKIGAYYAVARKAWASMRFVRAGWFTADEAMAYIEYFYSHLAPMTPISPPDFRHPSKHLALLTDEPILAITILMIASRHTRLSGHAALTRAARIHDTLWDYLRCMVERLLWGQEQFGGGFCAAGTIQVREAQGGQLTWKGSLRTLGTVEALLLLTDWQPRALHFPPGDDENRLLDTNYNLLSDSTNAIDDQEEADARQGRPYGAWLEPTWRSDRMSWMLLGLAQALSFELGVFDNNHYDCINDHNSTSSCARKRRVRRMVLVYVSQTSGRLGLPSMLPLPQWSKDIVFEETSRQQSHGQPEDTVDIMQSCWLGIARIMYDANKILFPTRKFTRSLTATDEYKEKIAEFEPMLKEWKENFDNVKSTFLPLMQHVLTMEYEYARCYINSLGLQKVVESWVSMPAGESNGTNAAHFDHQAKLRDLYSPNHEYIEAVADSARMILRSVVDGLAPGGNLRNAPVRTFLRSISGMMFTLKRFGVGAFEGDVRQALDLLDQCTDLMERDVVDDVHLSSQIAGLIKLLVANIRKTFIRVQGKENGSETASRQETPQRPTSQQPVVHHNDSFPQQPARKRPRMSASARHQQPRDPLEGIQAQPLEDLANHTFMPPPNFYQHNGLDTNMSMDPNSDPSMLDPVNMDWLTLPLDNLFNSSTGTVDQGFGGIGPTVGDRDMLELITNEHYDQWNMPNMPNMNGYYQ
jgi:hypothetical protein